MVSVCRKMVEVDSDDTKLIGRRTEKAAADPRKATKSECSNVQNETRHQ